MPEPDTNRRTKRPWSAADSEKLSSGVARFGVGKWALILKHTQFEVCWSNVDLKDRWRIIAKTREQSHEVVQEAVPPADAVTILSGLMQTMLPTELRDLVVKFCVPAVPLTGQSARWFLKLPSVSRDFRRAVAQHDLKERRCEMQLQAADDMLSLPYDVKAATVLADGSVCVVGQAYYGRGGRDFGEGQLVIYPPDGQSPRTLHLDYSPVAVFSAHDILYMIGEHHKRCSRLHMHSLPSLAHTGSISSIGRGANPGSMTLIGTTLFLVEEHKDQVVALEAKPGPATQRVRFTIGGTGRSEGKFNCPRCVASLGGQLVVCDTENHRLQIFEADGTFVRVIGRRGTAPGCFITPSSVAAAHGRLYVANGKSINRWEREANGRMQVLSAQGEPLQTLPFPSGFEACLYGWWEYCPGTTWPFLVSDPECMRVYLIANIPSCGWNLQMFVSV